MRPPQRDEREEVELGTPAVGSEDAEEEGDAADEAKTPSSLPGSLKHAGAGGDGEQEEGGAERAVSAREEATPAAPSARRFRVGPGVAEEGEDSATAPVGSISAAADPPEDGEGGGGDESEEEEHEELPAAETAGSVSSAPGSPDYIPAADPGSPEEISAAEGLETGTRDDSSSCASGGDDDDDFEFPSVFHFHEDDDEEEAADEILVRRVYPVFDRELFRFYLDQASRLQQPRGDAAGVLRVVGEGQGTTATKKKQPGQRMSLGRLMLEDERDRERGREPSTSSSEADELEGLPPESYCLWTPGGGGGGSPAPESPGTMRRRKSNSTGGAPGGRRWRLRDLVIGRSHSDGKKRFLYLASEGAAGVEGKGKDKDVGDNGKKQDAAAAVGQKKKKKPAPLANKKKGAKVSAPVDMDLVTAHRRINHGTASPERDGCSRQPALTSPPPPPPLPLHRQPDILGGLFANVNGATRSLLHPF